MNADAPATIEPLVKRVVVPLPPAQAFAAFTDEMAEWWPLPTHSVAGEEAKTVVVQPNVGGQIVETANDGTTCVWGTLTAYEPPAKVAFTWHPGSPVDEATHVEVVFTATAGGTEVVLTHTLWERRPDGAEARESYGPGWDFVVGRYVSRAEGGAGRNS